ncbi:prepilin-type N-terminal cleavage/methylation domain-containing protein [Parashewanella spongiae]|nr:prepilin-type N-terminal cleavage/methylation domain-containing protein [Parashewanella spongiae]MCL1078248.1 prepilin-type N-terminal cleavage/methylation domain-containing protein [Parashewanella spongiae]
MGSNSLKSCNNYGFTLIELVVGMLVMSIAIVMLSTMLFPQADRAAENLHRMRAAELAQSIMNEIWPKRYDQNTGVNGGVPACGSLDGLTCANRKVGNKNRNDFDVLDDYNGLNQSSLMLNSTQTYADVYPNYQMQVTVSTGTANTKNIAVVVTTPMNEAIRFDAVRSNY